MEIRRWIVQRERESEIEDLGDWGRTLYTCVYTIDRREVYKCDVEARVSAPDVELSPTAVWRQRLVGRSADGKTKKAFAFQTVRVLYKAVCVLSSFEQIYTLGERERQSPVW